MKMENNKTYISFLAAFASSLSYDSIPRDVRDKVKLCIIDALECCLSPMEDERVIAARSVSSGCGNGSSVMIGTGLRTGMADAAYYNTVKGSITNRNDIQLDSAVHAGAVIIPTVLAVAEQFHISGRQFMESVLAGYEISSRFGAFLLGKINKAWRTTAVFSPVGAAIAASKAMGLDENKTISAGSFACNSACGFNEWASQGTGEDAFQNGNSARSGVISALLAREGASACGSVIEGPSGFAAAFGISDGFEKLTAGLGEDWMIRRVIHKPIDCCIVVQAPCQCAARIMTEHPGINPEDISKIIISVDSRLLKHPGCANKDVNTLMQAVMSMAFGVSRTILNRGDCRINWMPPYGAEVREMMERCSFREINFDGSALETPVEIELILKNGDVINHRQMLEPLTDNAVVERFLSTAGKQLGEAKAHMILDMVNDLENISDINELTSLLL